MCRCTFIKIVLGAKIRKARKEKNLTLKELGERVNITYTGLSKIENDVNEPAKKTLILLAQELQTNFGLKWLNEHISKAAQEAAASKQEIIENMPIEEIFTLKFGDKKNRRTREEIIKLRHLADRQLEQMLDLENE